MSSCFGTIGGGNRRRPFRRYWALGPDALQRPIDGFEALGTSRGANHNMLGFVESTDKHKLANDAAALWGE